MEISQAAGRLGLRCGFAATDSRLYYDHVPPVINSGYVQNSRRDVPAGGPLRDVIIVYSGIMIGFYEPRDTNHEPLFFHEPRVTRGDVVILSLLPRSGI